MRADLTLRRSTPQDVPRLLELWRDSVHASHDFVAPDHLALIETMVAGTYLPSTTFLVAAGPDGRILGFLGANGNKVDALFVDPGVQGRGIGRALMAKVIEKSAEVFVDVNFQNHAAFAFYRRLGFVETGRSEVDGLGLPYPLVHLRYRRA